ncbi:MAG: hypothetical protein C4562_06840 [Actinobacteria bacterium]|nr:MAG: hypothetical protein C4562_06840 [Actinomycetota bacterium]
MIEQYVDESANRIVSSRAKLACILSISGVVLFWLFIAFSSLSWGLIIFNIAFYAILGIHSAAIFLGLISLPEIKSNHEKGYFFALGSLYNSAFFIFMILTVLRYLFFPKF